MFIVLQAKDNVRMALHSLPKGKTFYTFIEKLIWILKITLLYAKNYRKNWTNFCQS